MVGSCSQPIVLGAPFDGSGCGFHFVSHTRCSNSADMTTSVADSVRTLSVMALMGLELITLFAMPAIVSNCWLGYS